ncbi:MAG: NAD(P)/FAD-dependent oxidoreductase [Bacteroidota bacterium]|nr:NAD(P)/FAD-dependent oxidoreductase [Bacteroidota bacterium]
MINIPPSDKKRLVIVGSGFAGLRLARMLKNSGFQIVLIDKNNYYQFQPLFYQVATSGLEATSISFPLRKIFHGYRDFHIRIAEVQHIDPEKRQIWTTIGNVRYDYLVLAHGAGNFFFGMKNIEEKALPMKSVSEAITLRNAILRNFEKALAVKTIEERKVYLNIVIVGGGPSGVEVSGALAEMKKFVIPKDYPELKDSEIRIHLVQATDRLLPSMSERSSEFARKYLEKMGVDIHLNTQVRDFDGKTVQTEGCGDIPSNLVIWTAGIKGILISGIPEQSYGPGMRILTDEFNRVKGMDSVFAIGDNALTKEEKYPNGHPQLAQVALQQATLLSKNLVRLRDGKPIQPFHYKNKGTMATIGRNLAVVDVPFAFFHGTFAWMIWMFIHLMAILGTKNKLIIFLNWLWSYLTYDQSLRFIMQPEGCKCK